MGDRGYWIQRVADKAQLYAEPLPGVPIVEIAGDRRVLVERHHGVVEYGDHTIRVNVDFGLVTVSGDNLQLMEMTHRQIVIYGTIYSIQLQRRCK